MSGRLLPACQGADEQVLIGVQQSHCLTTLPYLPPLPDPPPPPCRQAGMEAGREGMEAGREAKTQTVPDCNLPELLTLT